MIDLASDLVLIRRYVARVAHRAGVEVDELVAETACEILGRVRRQPALQVSRGGMLHNATSEALRRVRRRSAWPRRDFNASIELVAAIPDDPDEVLDPTRSCSHCGRAFVPKRRNSHHCATVECGRSRAAERQRRCWEAGRKEGLISI